MLNIRGAVVMSLGLMMPLAGVADDTGWFVKPYGGYSGLSDTSGSLNGEVVDVSLDGGFAAGMGVGYRYNQRWSAEVAWEYRSNESETEVGPLTYGDGNYASNIFFVNGYRHFEPRGRFQPYVGVGLGWVQEIDIDLEGRGPEISYSGDGDVVFQVMAGADYLISEAWEISAEIRYANLTDVDLEGEGAAAGEIEGLDYEPITFNLGVVYRF